MAKKWAEALQNSADLTQLLEVTADVFQERYGLPVPRRFVLVVDQGEELYTRSLKNEARRFVELLAQGREHPEFLILGTLRADYYGHLLNDTVLSQVATRMDIPLLSEEDLCRAVAEPAKILEASFESEQMPTDIVAEVAREPGALPLLSYLMEDMWKRMQSRGDGMLRWHDYHKLGRVQGVLAQRARDFLETCSEAEQRMLRRFFTLRLIYVPREGEALRRRARRGEFTDAEWAQVQILAGQDWRLLVTSRQEEDEATAEVAHEVLLRAWNDLAAWIREEREFLVWKGRLDEACRDWQDTERSKEALLPSARVDEAMRWLAARAEDLDATEQEFIQASQEAIEAVRRRELEQAQAFAQAQVKVARRLRLLTTVLAAVLVLALGAALFARNQQQKVQIESDLRATEVAVRSTAEIKARQNERLAATRAVETILAQETAEARRVESERLRFVSIAQGLAVHASDEQARRQDERSALLARQAYLFNRRNQGPVL